jgi:predicted nucleotidyltransferase
MNERIRRLVAEALQGIDYKQIVLFGSRARGDSTTESDYDLLITVRGALSLSERIRIFGLVRRSLARQGIDADVIVKSEAEVEYLRDKIGSVVGSAVEEGVQL